MTVTDKTNIENKGGLHEISTIQSAVTAVSMNSSEALKISKESPFVDASSTLKNVEKDEDDECIEVTEELCSFPADWTGDTVRLVCISDTHGAHRELTVPPGDVLIHCGDITDLGTLNEIEDFDDWLGGLPHKVKIVVPGNHDTVLDSTVREFVKEMEGAGVYARWKEWEEGWRPEDLIKNGKVLINEMVEIEGLKILGFPYTIMGSGSVHPTQNVDKKNKYVHAFGCSSEEQLKEELKKVDVEDGVDIVVSHSPGRGIGADTRRVCHSSEALRDWVSNIQPKLHVFGHVHKSGGKMFRRKENSTSFVNAAMLKVVGIGRRCPLELEDMLNQPMVIDFCRKTKQIKFQDKTGNGYQTCKELS